MPTQQYTGKRRFRLPVEQSSEKLINYCCGANYHDNSLEEIKLGNDEEYPEWIWKLRYSKFTQFLFPHDFHQFSSIKFNAYELVIQFVGFL